MSLRFLKLPSKSAASTPITYNSYGKSSFFCSRNLNRIAAPRAFFLPLSPRYSSLYENLEKTFTGHTTSARAFEYLRARRRDPCAPNGTRVGLTPTLCECLPVLGAEYVRASPRREWMSSHSKSLTCSLA